MKTKFLFFTLTTLFAITSFWACEMNEGTTYQDVRVIISTSCAVVGCHNSTTAQSNIDYSSYATMSGANGRKNTLNKNNNGFMLDLNAYPIPNKEGKVRIVIKEPTERDGSGYKRNDPPAAQKKISDAIDDDIPF